MSEMKLSVSEIKELMDKMAAAGLSGLQLRDGDFELSMAAEVTRAAEPLVHFTLRRPRNILPSPLLAGRYPKATCCSSSNR